MECYAGMGEGIDRNCGKVFEYLKSTGEYDGGFTIGNPVLTVSLTMIIFMSDNGAEGPWVEGHPVLGPKMHQVIDRLYDNSLDNIGNHNSFVWYGQEWAQASTAPSRLYKMLTTEGEFLVRADLTMKVASESHSSFAIRNTLISWLGRYCSLSPQ